MNAFLFLVNPGLHYNPYPDWERWMPRVEAGGSVEVDWNTGTRRRGMEPGDLAVMVKVGWHPKGAIALGTIQSEIWIGPHWNPDAKRPDTGFVNLDLTTLLPLDDPFPLADLKLLDPTVRWTPRMCGTQISADTALKLGDIVGA
ncbi:MAG: hypothetical protein ACTH1Z_09950 [Ancrocorticia sp.]|uniref:hypothetical protein n=2 Tax=Ancrocorticia sp. TaxID=2593684 RepID=UPI003F90A003